MLTKNINEYTTEELSEIRNKIISELAERSRREREEAWHNVVEAMRRFTAKYDTIECNICGDTFYIDSHFECGVIGEITQD